LDRQPATTTTRRVEVIVVRQRAAIKDGKNPWSCTSVGQITQGVSSLIGSSQVQSVENLGPETLGAVAVWHVRATVMVALGGTPVPISADYYIAQADFTLLRETASASLTISGVTVTEKIVQDFSEYGERVSVKLPAACRGKGAAADALAAQMVRAAGSPAALATRLANTAQAIRGEIRRVAP
jgi:hypothetical protein